MHMWIFNTNELQFDQFTPNLLVGRKKKMYRLPFLFWIWQARKYNIYLHWGCIVLQKLALICIS